jgi:sigma-B regulation protein RsbU (phosphoserine phosphatase)
MAETDTAAPEVGFTLQAPARLRASAGEAADVAFSDSGPDGDEREAAAALIDHIFAKANRPVPGLSYAIAYQLASRLIGGDIVDVYHFNNDAVSIAVADIAGKGMRAAVHAALIKHGLRAYASQGLTPEIILRNLDRLYLDNNGYEETTSFATVFFGFIDPTRRFLTYSSAAHDNVFLLHPDGSLVMLDVTAPLIGAFDDQHHLFHQSIVSLREGTLIVVTTDGVVEARNEHGAVFGFERLEALVRASAHERESAIADAIVEAVRGHADDHRRDDIAVLIVRVA